MNINEPGAEAHIRVSVRARKRLKLAAAKRGVSMKELVEELSKTV